MSRSGYSDCLDDWALIRWRGAVASAIRGARGQALLREMLAALDAMPNKRLIANDLVTPEGEACALGTVALARGMDTSNIDPEDWEQVAKAFGVSEALVREIEAINDDSYLWGDRGSAICTPEERRWRYVRQWVTEQIKPEATGGVI